MNRVPTSPHRRLLRLRFTFTESPPSGQIRFQQSESDQLRKALSRTCAPSQRHPDEGSRPERYFQAADQESRSQAAPYRTVPSRHTFLGSPRCRAISAVARLVARALFGEKEFVAGTRKGVDLDFHIGFACPVRVFGSTSSGSCSGQRDPVKRNIVMVNSHGEDDATDEDADCCGIGWPGGWRVKHCGSASCGQGATYGVPSGRQYR